MPQPKANSPIGSPPKGRGLYAEDIKPPSKAESIAQAAKSVYDELRKVFDEDTTKELLTASMPAITEDVVQPRAIPYYSGVLIDPDKPYVLGESDPEVVVPLKNLERKELRWIEKVDKLLKNATKSNPTI